MYLDRWKVHGRKRRSSEELHSDEQSADIDIGDSQLQFTTACAISSTRDNLLQYRAAASAPRLVVESG